MTGILLAADGGQSALRLTVAGSPEPPVATVPGFTHHAGDPVRTHLDALAQAWEQLDVPGSRPVDRVVLGLTGLPGDPAVRQRLLDGAAAIFGAASVWACPDLVTAHAGALPDGHGVTLTVGTGVAAFAVDGARGTTYRVDGWGYVFGDGGSAFAVGRAGLAAVLRAHDGRGPETALGHAARQRYGELPGALQRLYAEPDLVDLVARFAPEVVAVAETGDAVARDIVAGAGGELARTAAAAVAAVSGAGPVPLAWTGRLLANAHGLRESFVAELAARCPRARMTPAAGGPLDGARRLAEATDPGPYASQVSRFDRTTRGA